MSSLFFQLMRGKAEKVSENIEDLKNTSSQDLFDRHIWNPEFNNYKIWILLM